MSQATSHQHSVPSSAARRLVISLVITLAFVVIEAIAGLMANSLALLTDAAHNVTDILALALSWYAIRLSTRPASSEKTFGYHRAGILAALINSTTLALIAAVIFYEASQRLLAPPRVSAEILTGVAAIGFVVNAGTACIVRRGSERT